MLTKEEAESDDFWELVRRWLAKSNLKEVAYLYKDGTSYVMTAEEYVRNLKCLLVEGMLGNHREIIKRELLEQ